MVARSGTQAGGLSLRSEAALRSRAIRPIWDASRSVGCHLAQAVHRGCSARQKSWRVVAARRSRPTVSSNPPDLGCFAICRVSLAAGSAPLAARRGTKAGGLSLRAEAALRSRAIRPIWDGSRSVGCHSPQAVHRGCSARQKSWRVVAARRSRPTVSSNPPDLGCFAICRVSLAAGSAPLVARRGTQAGGLSLRAEAALRSRAIRPIWDVSRSVGCHSPQAVHRWLLGAAEKLAGCRCAPKPPYGLEQSTRSGMVRDL